MPHLTGSLQNDLKSFKTFVMHPTTEGVYGPGSYTDKSFTPVPQDCKRLLKWLASQTPGFANDQKVLDDVKFEGDDLPSIPGAAKSVTLTAVLHAMVGIVGTPIVVTLDDKGAAEMIQSREISKIVPITDKGILDTPTRFRGWAIYKTKTPNTWYHIETSLTPAPVFKMLGIDPEDPSIKTRDEGYAVIQKEIEKYAAPELEMMMREKGFGGVTCFTPQAWRETGMGIALASHPLMSYGRQTYLPPTPPVPVSKSSDKRPLAGIKVVELVRVIAAPVLCAGLAAFGVDVVRVMSPHMPDITDLQITLTVGKRECALDLNIESDRAQLHKLLEEADVIIQGYRKGSLESKGFGLDAMLEMATRGDQGIFYIDENCFGPDGIYAKVPGWQQIAIADAASGNSYVMGRACGLPEGIGILPSLPIADLSTGAVGVVTTMLALRDRAKYGGSYHGNVALTAYQALSCCQK